MQTETSCPDGFVDLSPEQAAELLSITPNDVKEFTNSILRVRADWVNSYRTRSGSRDLNFADLRELLGVTERTVWRYFSRSSALRLAHRVGVVNGRSCKVVSPANLVLFLRERNRLAGAAPAIRETKGQRSRRAKSAQARVAAMCGDDSFVEQSA